MTRKTRKAKPTDPAEIARKAAEERARQRLPENWGVNKDSLALKTAETVHADFDGKGRASRAQRYDVFALLHTRGALPSDHLGHVRTFQQRLAERYRVAGGAAGELVKVDCPSRVSGVTDHALNALADLLDVGGRIAPRELRLLVAISLPTILRGEDVNWRAIVLEHTGEDRTECQAAAVRLACASLAEAYGAGNRGTTYIGEMNARAAA